MENAQGNGQAPDAVEQKDPGAVAEKVVAVEKRVQELVEAYGGARRAKWGISCGILLVVLIFCFLVYQAVASFDRQQLLVLMQEKAVSALPQTSAALRKVMLNVAPVYQKEMAERTKEALPEFTKVLEKEQSILALNLEKTVKDGLSKGLESSLKAQDEKLRKAFPSLKDDKKLNAVSQNLQDALQDVGATMFADKLELCVDELEKVHSTIQKFKPEGGPPAEGWFKQGIGEAWTDFLSKEAKPK